MAQVRVEHFKELCWCLHLQEAVVLVFTSFTIRSQFSVLKWKAQCTAFDSRQDVLYIGIPEGRFPLGTPCHPIWNDPASSQHVDSSSFRGYLGSLNTFGKLPGRNSKRLIHIFKGCEDVLLDGVKRPIQCPIDEDLQSACYGGKKLIAQNKPAVYRQSQDCMTEFHI